MEKKVYNFNPGPAVLPKPVLEQVQAELLDFNGTGMSILEISHRSKAYEGVHMEAEARMKKLLNLGDDYRCLFLQGGASGQFAMIPMNFLAPGRTADYLLTGSWSQKAYKEAARQGNVHIAASTEGDNFNRIPSPDEITFSSNPVYAHLTSNNTIMGTQWQDFPECGEIPLMADMSSDILSRPFAAKKFALIYAGAQKNLGPAGVTVVVIKNSLLEQIREDVPIIFNYKTHADNNSLYNTPPVFAIYIVNLVLKWIEDSGGLAAIEAQNREKAALIYKEIDESGGFYRGHAQKDSRSLMNITFRLPNPDLEKKFVEESTANGLIGLKGHRSVGGMRASLYNAMTLEGAKTLAAFMREFREKNS
jgi:phosphoserine aminotransferase